MVVPFACGKCAPHNARPRGFRLALAALSAVAVLATASRARADTIQTFYLNNVHLVDGGSVTGNFTFDETSGQPYNVDITITDPVLSAAPLFGTSPIVFLDANLSAAFDNAGTIAIFSYDDDFSGLALVPVDPIGVTNDDLSTTSQFYYDGNSIAVNFANGGSLSTSPVPEPASLAVFATGLLGLRLMRRRKATRKR